MEMYWPILIIVPLILFLVWMIIRTPNAKENVEQLEPNLEVKLTNAIAGGFLPIIPKEGLILEENEYSILYFPAALWEEGSTRQYAGVGLPIGKGARIYTGASEAASILKRKDSGTLAVTTDRFIYTGKLQSRNIEFKKIVNIHFDADGIIIHVKGGQKTIIFKTIGVELFRKIFETVRKHRDELLLNPVDSERGERSLIIPSVFIEAQQFSEQQMLFLTALSNRENGMALKKTPEILLRDMKKELEVSDPNPIKVLNEYLRYFVFLKELAERSEIEVNRDSENLAFNELFIAVFQLYVCNHRASPREIKNTLKTIRSLDAYGVLNEDTFRQMSMIDIS
jgi:hypothetical protein